MFKYVEGLNDSVWNGKFNEVEKEIEDNKAKYEKIPRVQAMKLTIGIIKGSITGSKDARSENLKIIKELEGQVNLYNKKKEQREELVQELVKLNKEAVEAAKEEEKKEEEKEETNDDILGSGEKVEPTKINERPEAVVDIKEMLDNIEVDMKLVQAECTLWKGLLLLQNNSPVKGGLALRKSWMIYKAIHANIEKGEKYHQDIRDVCLTGVGTFYYIMSIMPSTVAKVLTLIGFVQNREQGIAYLHEVFENNGITAPNSALMLAVNYLFVPRALADAHEYIAAYSPLLLRCILQYPEGFIFRFMASQLVKKTGQLEAAGNHLNIALESCKEVNVQPNLFVFELGQSYFQSMNFEKAEEIFQDLIKVEEDFDFKTFAGLETACCMAFQGRMKEAKDMIDLVPSMVKSKPGRIDQYITDKLKIIGKLWNKDLNRLEVILKISAFEMLYLRRDLAHMQPEDLQAVREEIKKGRARIKELKAEKDLSDMLAATLVILAQIERNEGNVEKAEKKFRFVLSIQKSIRYEQQWLAFSNYELGEIMYHKGELKESYDLMKAALKFSKYPFEEILKARTNLAIKQLKKEMKK